jgi:broad specificity phosphatase PhoE
MHVELIIVRHGETMWTLSGQHTGVTDLPLTANGEREAERLLPLLLRLLAGRVPAVYTSPSQRAIETARLSLPHFPFGVEPLLAEYLYGRYEGLTSKQIHDLSPSWNIWRDGCPDGETTDEVGDRADQFLNSRVVSDEKPVVAVTHGHFSRILAARALARPPRDGAMFASSTASMSVIRSQDGERSLYLWNMTAYDAEG